MFNDEDACVVIFLCGNEIAEPTIKAEAALNKNITRRRAFRIILDLLSVSTRADTLDT